MTIQIVILAMIAAFLGLRLYSVLGRRAEHEEEIIQGRFEDKPGLPGAPNKAAPRLPASTVQAPNPPRREMAVGVPVTERGLREIAQADLGRLAASFRCTRDAVPELLFCGPI